MRTLSWLLHHKGLLLLPLFTPPWVVQDQVREITFRVEEVAEWCQLAIPNLYMVGPFEKRNLLDFFYNYSEVQSTKQKLLKLEC